MHQDYKTMRLHIQKAPPSTKVMPETLELVFFEGSPVIMCTKDPQ